MQKLWDALAALGESVIVQSGGPLELTLPDKTVDVDRVAAKLGVSLQRGYSTGSAGFPARQGLGPSVPNP